MTYKEWLCSLSAEKFFEKVGIIVRYVQKYPDARNMVIQLLDKNHYEGFGTWVFGSLEDGGF